MRATLTLAAARSRPPSRPMIALSAAVVLAARAPDPWSKPIIVLDASNFTEATEGALRDAAQFSAILRNSPRGDSPPRLLLLSSRRQASRRVLRAVVRPLQEARAAVEDGEPAARRGARGRRGAGRAAGGGRRDRREGARRPLRRARLPGDQVVLARQGARLQGRADGARDRQLRHPPRRAGGARRGERDRARGVQAEPPGGGGGEPRGGRRRGGGARRRRVRARRRAARRRRRRAGRRARAVPRV